MNPADVGRRVEEQIRRHDLIPPGGDVRCLVSGGPDSTCLWHVLRGLGYGVSALHVNHHVRGAESDEDARFCADAFGAEVVDAPASTEAELRELRYSFATHELRATGHTASDQVETVLYRLVSSGKPGAIKAKREDGVVRPLLTLWRHETEAYCRAVGVPVRADSSNPRTKRGLIRERILPLLRELDLGAEQNLLALAEERPRLPRGLEATLHELLGSRAGTRSADLGRGLRAVREYDDVWLEHEPVPLEGPVRWGPWRIESEESGLVVRGWRPGDRLAGRRKKVQDVFVDAKVPRAQRRSWPLVVRGDDVVAVPGVVDAAGVRVTREDGLPDAD